MPAARSTIILIDEYLTKYNTIRNALVRDKALETVKVWDEVSTYILKSRQSLINELKLGKDGSMTKLDVAILAANEKYSHQTSKMSNLTANAHKVWLAKSENEARKIALTFGWDENKFQALLKNRPAKLGKYEYEQPKLVVKQPDYRPPIIEDEEPDDNSTNNSEHSNNPEIDLELQRLLNGEK